MWHLKTIPKILHVYWGGGKLPYLRYLTLASFRYYNPDWKIILYRPINTAPISWTTSEQKYGDNYKNWISEVVNLSVTITEIDFSKIGFTNSASDVHKSDYLRWILLSDIGGLWADMDIIFIRPMEDLYFNLAEFAPINCVYCISQYGHSIGFLMGGAGNTYFDTIKNRALNEYKKEKYQCIGSTLCNTVFPSPASIRKSNPHAYNLSMDVVYPHDANHVSELFNGNVNKITQWTIGIHWYAGSEMAGKHLNNNNGGFDLSGDTVINRWVTTVRENLESSQGDKKISIVMAYYNRQNLLDKTIESIKKSSIKNYELIIVDDASDTPVQCDGAKIIRVDKKDKWYTCSAVAFNRGFREATGDIIIIQNPECYHVGDVLKYVQDNMRNNAYLSFACYAMNSRETAAFHTGVDPVINNQRFSSTTGNGWYNHIQYRPVAYHFCSAILRKDLDKIGGFDERYAMGVAFDDDDFIRWIRNSGMNVKIINEPYVLHQYHTHFEFDKPSAWREPHRRNNELYNSGYNPNVPKDYSRNVEFFRGTVPPWDILINNYNKYYLNYTGDKHPRIPRRLHMTWLGSSLPTQYNELIGKWKRFHPDWDFKLWTDDDVNNLDMVNRYAYDKIANFGIKSTLLRYEILYQYGGLAVDTDFECLKSFDDLLYLDFFGGGRDGKHGCPILAEGLIGCTQNNKFIKAILNGINTKQRSMSYLLGDLLKEVAWEYITKEFLGYVKKTSDKMVIFPDAFFYPMPNSFRDKITEYNDAAKSRINSYVKPSTYCVHLWHTSWVPPEDRIVVIPATSIAIAPIRTRPQGMKIKGSTVTGHKVNRRKINRAKKALREQQKKINNGLDTGR